MPIQTSNPVQITEPDKPFDKLAIWLAVSPVFNTDSIGAAINLTVEPYRVLNDGTIERSNRPRVEPHADAFADMQSDSDLATAVSTILGALGVYIAAKGL